MKKIHLMVIALILLSFSSCEFGGQDGIVYRSISFNVPGMKSYYFNVPEGEVPDSSNFPDDPDVEGFVFEGWRRNINNSNENNVFLSTEEYDLNTPIGTDSVDLFAVLIPSSWAEEGSVYRQLEEGKSKISIDSTDDLKQLSEITNMRIEGSDTFSLNSVPKINSGFDGVTVIIEKDIDLSSVSFDPIAENYNYYLPRFSGTIQGVSGGENDVVTVSGLSDSLIAVATGNVTVRNIKLSGEAKTAGFIKVVEEGEHVVLENCISDVGISAENEGEGYTNGFGGFIGEANASYIELKNLKATGSVDVDDVYDSVAGGIAGKLTSDGFDISDLEVTENVLGGRCAGGFFGSINTSGDLDIRNAVLNTDSGNTATISGSYAAGGIIGEVSAGDIKLSSCSVNSYTTITPEESAGAYIGRGNCLSIEDSSSTNNTSYEKYGDTFSSGQNM